MTALRIEGACREAIEKCEWLATGTAGSVGPHMAACWTRNVLAQGIDGEEICIPAWHMESTEANLARDPRVEPLFVARAVRNSDGYGQGCTVRRGGTVETSGPRAEAVRRQFPWARGVLVVKIEGARTHLP